MKNVIFLLILSLFSILFLGCNTYVDSGKATKSSLAGYQQYSNKTINVAVLTPDGWATRVSIGGEYMMTSSDPKRTENRRSSIIISSSPVEALSKTGAASSIDGSSEAYKKSRLPLSTTLEAFKNNRLAFLTEKNIGPKLRVSSKKSRLANHDAYEILYSYKVKGISQRQKVQETFTLLSSKVYRIIYYADEDVYDDYLKVLEVLKKSYRIL